MSADNDGSGANDFPKASIGNYKGVMLCNRPNEFGQQRRVDRTGLEPFNSRVDPKIPIGWNPCMKLLPQVNKKKRDPNSALARHKLFLKKLEQTKVDAREETLLKDKLQELKTQNFKARAAEQREKITKLKETDDLIQEAEAVLENKPVEEKAQSEKQQSKASTKGKKKPAWATTEKQQEEIKEAEIDELLEFAYELDYEKYMEDFEVRQALAVIKERVAKITEEPDWKEKMAEEWNNAPKDVDRESHAGSCKSGATQASNASKKSYSQRMAEVKENQSKAEFDTGSLTSEQRQKKAEDRLASKIATEVLAANQKLRGVHSKESIKKILEKEAIKQMQAQGYQEPVVAYTNERERVDKADPSNLPYLHKNPAV